VTGGWHLAVNVAIWSRTTLLTGQTCLVNNGAHPSNLLGWECASDKRH